MNGTTKNHPKNRVFSALSLALLLLAASSAYAATTTVEVYQATPDGHGNRLGTVAIEETKYGLVFTPSLNGLNPGTHGFHVHANSDDGPSKDPNTGAIVPAGAAGGHFDPNKTNRHGFPWEDNAHLGDLPPLFVNADRTTATPVLAPRLKSLDDIRNRVLMIHEGGDNHSDHPKPLGGGGARVASGTIR